MKKTILAGLALLPVLMLTGCTGDIALKYQTIEVEDFIKHPNAEEDYHGLQYAINFTFPVEFNNEAVLKTLQRKFIAYTLGENYASLTLEAAINACIEDWKKEYNDEMEEFISETGFVLAYEHWISNSILLSTDRLLQLYTEGYSYLGGAHGSSGASAHLFNLQTGEEYSRNDIFKPESHESIRRIIDAALLEYWEEEVDYEKDCAWTETTHFALTPQGVMIVYSDYELGYYALGRPEITIPYAQILPHLREGTPVWDFTRKNI